MTTTYSLNLKYYHENSESPFSQGSEKTAEARRSFVLFYYFNSLLLEERIETLVFDLGDFFSSAGGNLGLFLGCSCLSILFSFISAIEFASKFLIVHRIKKVDK